MISEEMKLRRREARLNTYFEPKACKRCGIVFEPRSGNAKVCDSCRTKYRREQRSIAKIKYLRRLEAKGKKV